MCKQSHSANCKPALGAIGSMGCKSMYTAKYSGAVKKPHAGPKSNIHIVALLSNIGKTCSCLLLPCSLSVFTLGMLRRVHDTRHAWPAGRCLGIVQCSRHGPSVHLGHSAIDSMTALLSISKSSSCRSDGIPVHLPESI